MTLSLPFPAALIALLTGARPPVAPAPTEDAAPQSDHLRRDIGLPPEAAPPSALTVLLRAKGGL